MSVKKKVFWIAALIIIAAVAVVLGVTYFTGRRPTEYNGTLVKTYLEIPWQEAQTAPEDDYSFI